MFEQLYRKNNIAILVAKWVQMVRVTELRLQVCTNMIII